MPGKQKLIDFYTLPMRVDGETAARIDDIRLTERIFVTLVVAASFQAVLNICCHIAQITGISFTLFAWTATLSAAAAALIMFRLLLKRSLPGPSAGRGASFLLLAAAGFCSLISLITYRPDLDDIHYIPNVRYYLENASDPMGFLVFFFASGEKLVHSPFWGNSTPFEFGQGALSYLTGTELLTLYYIFFPALFSFLVPFAWYYLLTRFSFSGRASVFGAIVICLALCLMGAEHREFGNFSFTRIFQGKTVLFALGLPLLTAVTVDYFRQPCPGRWFVLFLTASACTGLTNSSAMMLPVFAATMVIAARISYLRGGARFVKGAVGYLCAYIYCWILGAALLFSQQREFAGELPSAVHYPTSFAGHADFVFSGTSLLFFMIATPLAMRLVQKRDRNFLAGWLVVLGSLFLNPLIAPVIMQYITSNLVYWRLFYLLPFPLVVGIVAAAAADTITGWRKNKQVAFLYAVPIVLILLQITPFSRSIFTNKTRIGLPEYEVVGLDQARSILGESPPPGAMLALPVISHSLPMLSGLYPQMRIREDGPAMWLGNFGRVEEAYQRILASDYLGGRGGREGYEALLEICANSSQLKSIVMKQGVASRDDSAVIRSLNQLGFKTEFRGDGLVLLVRN